ncbi:MAG: imidazole glycerol phosphate synthase subunit HisH [Acidimicrobiaceae bacterium]|nr:imidazole glycerol phosphate synthase subunit HisH [Acidimicrobiaceae bacterium]MBT5580895.1 imidazole glycerol phosphate synthase subunit HisH [Acidimicrobiaceae bacterium]MBT5848877.1 imidazole glycerol phosphate synthase subunit HisH [Acidimicrobiaceae bacterium]
MTTTGATRPLIAILNYGIGNLHSAHKGFEHAGADARLTSDRGLIADADAVVLPGVGAFGPCMDALRNTGLDEVALERIDSGIPFFAICIGQQLLFAGSEESPGRPGLGVFDGMVRRIPDTVKRPQMQWNIVHPTTEHPMFDGLGAEPWLYFVHSYACEHGPDVVATCDYGDTFVAAVARDNLWACQFHPEKSSHTGLQILGNFVSAAATASTKSSR